MPTNIDYAYIGNATAGLQPIGTYVDGDIDGNIAELLRIIPNPDAALNGSGAVGGSVGGGSLDEMSPGAAAQLIAEIIALGGGSAAQRDVASGQVTVSGAQATANLVDIVTGIDNITLANCAVTVFRAGTNVTADAVITEPVSGTLRIADGSTYNTTAGDVINYLARR